MKSSIAIVLALLVGACASRPPAPLQCEGELVPINAPKSASSQAAAHEARRGS